MKLASWLWIWYYRLTSRSVHPTAEDIEWAHRISDETEREKDDERKAGK
jgi:hypothetical protein